MKIHIFDFAWIIFCVMLVWNIFSLSQNTLEHNAKWNSTKISLGKGVNGSHAFFVGTQALARNRLHLNAWNGFQEVTTKQSFIPSQIEFTLTLDADSYIYAQIDHTQDTYSAFRLSVNKQFPSAYIIAKEDGEFNSTDLFDANLQPDQRYRIQISIIHEESAVTISKNGNLLKKVNYTPKSISAPIGFRGSSKPSSIENVKIIGKDGTVLFYDTFTYNDTNHLIFLIISGILIFIGWKYFEFVKKKASYTYVWTKLTLEIISVIVLMSFTLLNRYVSDKYPDIEGIFSRFWQENETAWQKELIQNKTNMIQTLKPKRAFRIAFIGGSQTFGVGASSENDTFVAKIQTLINTSGDVECINAAVSGLGSAQLLDLYKAQWKDKLDPDMLVINMSNNDTHTEGFADNLKEFVKINGSQIQTVFVLEANSPEKPIAITKNHRAMTQVGRELHIPTFDLHGYLSKHNDTGILWWDYVHLTSYGHTLTAQYLSDSITPIIKAEQRKVSTLK